MCVSLKEFLPIYDKMAFFIIDSIYCEINKKTYYIEIDLWIAVFSECFSKFETVKRKDFIKTATMISAGIMVLDKTQAAINSLQESTKKIKNINPLATQNTVVIILGGGMRWELDNQNSKPSQYQIYTRAAMPNLFKNNDLPIRDLELLLKQTLNQKILSNPLESSGKYFHRNSEQINHGDAVSNILGFNTNNISNISSGFLTLDESSDFYKNWILKAKRKDRIYYHHDLPGNSRKIFGINESVDSKINQYLIQHTTDQRVVSDSKSSEPLPMFTEALGYIQEFKPKFTVLHPRLLDIAHTDFRQALINMNRLDYSIAWLYSQLQTINPSFSLNTNWIILPDHGRDYETNVISKKLGSFDHHTLNAQNSWMLLNGPKINAASSFQDFLPFINKTNAKSISFSNKDVFNTIASLTK